MGTGDNACAQQLRYFCKQSSALTWFLETTQYKNGHNPAELTEEKLRYKSDTTLEEAKTLYPEWYQRRIVEKAAKNSWKFNTALYDKWLTYIREQAKVGHRYYCIGSIAVMAIKCGIDKKQVYEDSMALLSYLDSIGYDSDADAFNHFTEKDLNDAINTFYKPENAYYSRKSIEYLTAVHADIDNASVIMDNFRMRMEILKYGIRE